MSAMSDAYERLAADVAALVGDEGPVVVGIAGGVGESTTAARLQDHLSAAAVTVEVVGTDAFLLPNDELERRDLSMRKGFPETFDTDALASFLRAVRAGAPEVRVPIYSHTTYDRVPHMERVLTPTDVLVVEGVNALQPPVVEHLAVAVYIDAAEEDMAAWFVDRFLSFCEEARDDEESFYRGFVGMSVAQQRGIAEWTWREINLVNLREHIAPSQAAATEVLSKGRDHSVRS